jgi:hypothetical protein
LESVGTALTMTAQEALSAASGAGMRGWTGDNRTKAGEPQKQMGQCALSGALAGIPASPVSCRHSSKPGAAAASVPASGANAVATRSDCHTSANAAIQPVSWRQNPDLTIGRLAPMPAA